MEEPDQATGENRPSPGVEGDGPRASRPVNVFRVVKNGPLLARGDLILATEDGHVVRRDKKAAFCRCGHSWNKPFCDGTHGRLGLDEPVGMAPEGQMRPLPEGDPGEGPVTILMKPTGSLRLVGPVTVVDAEGREHVGSRASLCRCGASKQKPWCDNSHREIDFRAD
jgi:CDGSH-type Zn-finger protein